MAYLILTKVQDLLTDNILYFRMKHLRNKVRHQEFPRTPPYEYKVPPVRWSSRGQSDLWCPAHSAAQRDEVSLVKVSWSMALVIFQDRIIIWRREFLVEKPLIYHCSILRLGPIALIWVLYVCIIHEVNIINHSIRCLSVGSIRHSRLFRELFSDSDPSPDSSVSSWQGEPLVRLSRGLLGDEESSVTLTFTLVVNASSPLGA